jgi:hypothetical protein
MNVKPDASGAEFTSINLLVAPICGVTLHQVPSIWCSNVVFRKYGAPEWRNRASRPAPPIRERPR